MNNLPPAASPVLCSQAGIRARKFCHVTFPCLRTVVYRRSRTHLPLRGQHRHRTCFPFNRATCITRHLKAGRTLTHVLITRQISTVIKCLYKTTLAFDLSALFKL